MFDSHTHINSDKFESNREDILIGMSEHNIGAIIVGTNIKDSILAKDIVKDYTNLKFSAGIHPHDSDNIIISDTITELEKLILEPDNVAIGECGFDFYYNDRNKLYEKQEILFRMQIELAEKYNKPLIIHTRESFQDTYDILKEYRNLKVIYHCFSGNEDWFNKLNSLMHDSYFSFSGIITFKNNVTDIQNSVKVVPIDKILAETDSPYLAPIPFRGKQNNSLNIKFIVEKIADLRGISYYEMERILDRNAHKAFNI